MRNIRLGDKVWIKSPPTWEDKWHRLGVVASSHPTFSKVDNTSKEPDTWLVRAEGDYGNFLIREKDFQVLMN